MSAEIQVMHAYIRWPHFSSRHKIRKVDGKFEVLVEAKGGKWRWYKCIDHDYIICDGMRIPVNIHEGDAL